MSEGMLDQSSLARIIVLRILCAGDTGCTFSDLKNEIQPFVSHRLSPGEWRQTLKDVLDNLLEQNLIGTLNKDRFVAQNDGLKSVLDFLNLKTLPTKDWKEFKAVYLIAKALELKSRSSKTLKPLKMAEGIRAAIVKKYFNLPLKAEIPGAVQIRNALALHTIGEAFEAPKESKFSGNSRVPEKLALFLASRKLHRPREVETSSQLLTLLAAEAVGSLQADPSALRLALIRKLVNRSEKTKVNKDESLLLKSYDLPKTSMDLVKFSGIVHKLAKTRAKGWSGNKRAYISHVWDCIKNEKTDLKLDEHAFKSMLTDAHRAGHLTLAIADLRDKENITDIQNSVTRYKNTEWHFIRVED